MRRFISMMLLVAAVPLLVVLAEVARSLGTVYLSPAVLSCAALVGIAVLCLAALKREGVMLVERLEVAMMWMVLCGFALAAYFVWSG